LVYSELDITYRNLEPQPASQANQQNAINLFDIRIEVFGKRKEAAVTVERLNGNSTR